MEIQAKKPNDISRLCETVGLDPSTYISLENGERFKNPVAVNHKEDEPRHGIELLSAAPVVPIPVVRPQVRSTLPVFHEHSSIAPLAQSSSRRYRAEPVQIGLLSLAGGTGKTSLAAVLGRVLLSRGHSVLLADHSPFNAMHNL